MSRFQIAGYTFAPRLRPTLATGVILIVLLSLGTWQMARLQWKEHLIATINQRLQQVPVNIDSLSDTTDLDYDRAIASGTFQSTPIFYEFALSDTGRSGYHVLVPLRLTDGRWLLVDRGWIAYAHKVDFLQAPGTVNLSGILRRPVHHWFQPQNDPLRNDWYWIDLTTMAHIAHVPALLPYVLEVDAQSNHSGDPLGGQTHLTLPNNHFGYALTWYGLALVLLVIYVTQTLQKNTED